MQLNDQSRAQHGGAAASETFPARPPPGDGRRAEMNLHATPFSYGHAMEF